MKDIEDRRGGEALSKEELDILEETLEALESKFDMPLLPVAELYDYDDDFIDIVVKFKDGDEEHMALERAKLRKGWHPTLIAQWIY